MAPVLYRRPEEEPRLRYISPQMEQFWEFYWPPEMFEEESDGSFYQRLSDFTGQMHRAGVGILAGTDVAGPFVFPGFSLHDELLFLHQAGLSPLAALQAATLNPAKFFGTEAETGSVEVGKAADLVLLDANPLEDIRNTRNIRAVVVQGKLLRRSELDQMLQEASKTIYK